ncbi:hypothetical protein [Mesorhizobium sp. M0041]|uniref:hypothetical protein n=1 Tax=Mesorhizobium sp. M0041 TaxID=2956856 RepID=UPI00333B8D4D
MKTYTFVYEPLAHRRKLALRTFIGYLEPERTRMSLPAIKASILKSRRQRIRRVTYDYVASVMVEDIAFEHPFRDRMVIDWWSRVVDPLEAESFDRERLSYFRERLAEHKLAAVHNAALRRGDGNGNELRRLTPKKLAYMKHQVRRLADRRLNYAAALEAYRMHDRVYEGLVLGLVALKELKVGPKGFMLNVAWTAQADPRFRTLIERVRATPEALVPGRTVKWIEQRIGRLTSLEDAFWYPKRDHLFELKQAGLIRKLEDKYLSKIS